ncbi:unnamed protein product [Haemonchus placei]|uniref:LMBR1-like membrane protein n=1 Tax=Haemonchus placei TaxID=6290 RepID=A0A0N4WSY3_HAEPC|nr:unnamed protein product [Haemonchus placei]
MWTSWFGGFSEPSDYATAEMPDINVQAVLVSAIFVIPYLAFLVILPGVREKRIITLVIITVVTLTGAVLAASLCLPGWAGGSARILSQLRSHVNERMRARVGVNVGLKSINITLRFEEMVEPDRQGSRIDMSRLYYNENFDISGVSSMTEELRSAYRRGLPYPILSILEYFSLNQDAFDWGRHYRTAGHYTSAAISFALSCWALAVVFVLLVPHHFGLVSFDSGAYFSLYSEYAIQAMLATGLSALFACLLYLIMSPCELQIGFVGTQGNRIVMKMSFQWAFYCVFAVGLLAVLVGLSLIILQHYHFYSLSTFLEARLDETVNPNKTRQSDVAQDLSNSLQVMRRTKNSAPSSVTSEKKTASSGFQSRTSYTGSMSIPCSGANPLSNLSTVSCSGRRQI